MSNKKMNLSGTGKDILESLCDQLEVDRPLGIKIALAKGISEAKGEILSEFNDHKPKWTIAESIIRDKEFLLFKHLIINELETPLSEEEINNHMLKYIEFGLRTINKEIQEISSLEDYRIKILG